MEYLGLMHCISLDFLLTLHQILVNMADNDIIKQNKTEITSPHGELFNDACSIIEQARAAAYRSVNDTLIKRNWLLGLRIQH